MTATEVEPKPRKLNLHELDLITQILDELTRIYGGKDSKDPKVLKLRGDRLSKHINRPDGTLKTAPCLIDQRDELRKMAPAEADDRI